MLIDNDDEGLNRYRSVGELKTGILHIDAIQEGTQVLVLDESALLNAGADLTHVFKVNALHGQHILLFLGLAEGDSFRCIDALVDLESQEVLDFDCLDRGNCTFPFSMTLATIGKCE